MTINARYGLWALGAVIVVGTLVWWYNSSRSAVPVAKCKQNAGPCSQNGMAGNLILTDGTTPPDCHYSCFTPEQPSKSVK